MPMLRAVSEFDASPRAVAGVLRDPDAIAEALARDGHRLVAPARLLAVGDEVRFSARLWPGAHLPLHSLVCALSEAGMVTRLGGPLREFVHVVTLTPSGSGTSMVDELRWTGLLGVADRAVRAFGSRAQVARTAVVRSRVAGLGVPPARVVVATALVRDGRVLAAQRAEPARCAGLWELPGGSVEPGESEPEAVARECREELGTDVVASMRLGTDLPINVGVLRVYTARLLPGAPEPRALEHAALRWLGPGELTDLPWLDADRAVVAELVALLGGR